MKHSSISLAAARVASLALAGVLPIAAQAQMADEPWKFGATLYGWFPALGGRTAFPTLGGFGPTISTGLDVSAPDLIDALNMAFMGTFEATKGKYGFYTDLFYTDLGAAKSGVRSFTLGGATPTTVASNIRLDIKQTIWTLAGSYNLASTPEYSTDLLVGARMADLKQGLSWQLANPAPIFAGLPRAGSASVNASNWDGIIGIKGRVNLGAERKWFIPYYLDVGTGESKLTWQAVAGVGYDFSWGSVTGVWRHLDYDFKSGSKISSLNLSGVQVGATWRW